MTAQQLADLDSRATVSGHPTMVSWSRGKPRLYLADTDGPIDLAGLVGEEIRVDVHPGFRCQHCGDRADDSPCQECQSKPPFQQCVFTPGTSCEYQDCPFPSFKRRSCAHNFVVYLVAKDSVKAGTTQADRAVSRWAEQGDPEPFEPTHVIAPERTHHDADKLEIIAPVKLRDELALTDEQEVTVRVTAE